MNKRPHEWYYNLKAYARYEIDGNTVLHISPGFMDSRVRVGEKITFSSHLNDSPQIHDLDLTLDRSVYIVEHVRKMKKVRTGDIEEKGGYYVTVSLDIDSMPATKRLIDGFIRKSY